MTFTDLKTVVKDYCGLTSTDADTRIGKAINRHYRRITASLGLDVARFVTRTTTTTNGVQTVTFTEIEKIDRVIDTTDSAAIRLLTETSVHEIRSAQPGSGQAERWAFQNSDADSVTILLDTVPQTTYSLQADGWTTLSDLSGTDEPVFPESYHDVLAWYVISEELLKKEKEKLPAIYMKKAEDLIADLRFFLADSHTRETVQGAGTATPGGTSSGGSGTVGGTSYTQTGLITFDRDPSYPFVVTSGSAKVDNLDADKLDGFDESAFAKLADNEAVTAAWTFSGIANTGLKVLDTNASHALTIKPGSDITAARTLTFTTGDADRTVTYSGNPTLADWFDQSVKAAATPTFAGASFGSNTLSGAVSFAGIANTGLKVLDTNASHVLSLVPGSDITANRALTLTTGDADRTITLSGNPTLADWFDQSVKVASTPTFGATTVTGALTISGASAGQIVFPASQNASAGANTLDDYEEGSWTPVIGGAGGTSGQTYTTQVGRYIKIGKMVWVQFYAQLSAKGTITGALEIQGLPFASENTASLYTCGPMYFESLTTSFVNLVPFMAPNTSVLTVRGLTGAGTSMGGLASGDVSNTTLLIGSATYRAAN